MDWMVVIADLMAEISLDRDYLASEGRWQPPTQLNLQRAHRYAKLCKQHKVAPPEMIEEDGEGGLSFVFPDFRKEFR